MKHSLLRNEKNIMSKQLVFTRFPRSIVSDIGPQSEVGFEKPWIVFKSFGTQMGIQAAAGRNDFKNHFLKNELSRKRNNLCFTVVIFFILMKNNKTKDESAEEQEEFLDMNTNFQTTRA